MKLCKNGLHEKPGPGRCQPCLEARRVKQNEAQKRYRRTPKGFATNYRYAHSAKGQAAQREWRFLHPD